MLVLAGEIHHLRHFGFRHLIGVDAALADAVLVDVQHDTRGVVLALAEETHDDMHDELHRRVVVIEEEDAIEVRPLRLRPRFGDNRGAKADLSAIVLARVLCHSSPPGVSTGVI